MQSLTPPAQGEDSEQMNGASPSMRTVSRKRRSGKVSPLTTPLTAVTELMTPMLDSPTPLRSLSSQPGTASVVTPYPREQMLTDMAASWDDDDGALYYDASPRDEDGWKSKALFRDDRPSPNTARKRPSLSGSDSLPPPIPAREDLIGRTFSGGSAQPTSRRKSRSSRRTKSVSMSDDPFSSPPSLGIPERRRSSSHATRRSFSNFSLDSADGDDRDTKFFDTTPVTTSCSDSSPDSSPSPSRDLTQHRRHRSSPTPAEIELLPLHAKLTYKLGRVRTNKLVMVLCLFGVLSVAITVSTNRSLTSFQDDSVMNAEQLEAAIRKYEKTHGGKVRRPHVQPEAGLRGQLLLKHQDHLIKKKLPKAEGDKAVEKELVREDNHKKSGTHDAPKKQQASTTKPKERHSSAAAPKIISHKFKSKQAAATAADSSSKTAGMSRASEGTINSRLRFAHPLPRSVLAKRTFQTIDESMFVAGAKQIEGSEAPRLVSLHEPITDKTVVRRREIKSYPADFTDNTQLYSILDSNDERLAGMEIRDPYSDEHCVPMQEWQTTFHPSCNGMHEIALEHMGGDVENDFHLFGTKGYWRNAWKIDILGNHHHAEERETMVLKTLKFQHNFEDAHFEHDRIDAVAMERLTASPHVINVFGFCGHSVITEYADGSRVGELADKSKKRWLARLRIARDIANGLADVHGIDGDGNATFVHLDINPANVVSVGGTLKLNDFNIGIIRRWNATSDKPCGFPAQYPNPQWRSPEEARNEQNLTEKVDIFSMGHIFFRLICGHEPWNKLEPGGRPSKEEVNRKVQQGILPFIPAEIMNTRNKEVVAIREAMLRCYEKDPEKRPGAREIANLLQEALDELTDGYASEHEERKRKS